VDTGRSRVTRPYRSQRRAAQARRTRGRVLDAATALFVEGGYGGTTMGAVATRAGVSLPTVELLFGTKAHLLRAAIDVAIAGDDEPVPVLERAWTDAALAAGSAEGFLAVAAEVLGAAQTRSAGLVLAVFEGSARDGQLAARAEQMIGQRAATAGWLVDALSEKAPLLETLSRQEAVDTLWILMDPAVFDRLVRHRRWTVPQYQEWFVRSARRLLLADTGARPYPTPGGGECREPTP